MSSSISILEQRLAAYKERKAELLEELSLLEEDIASTEARIASKKNPSATPKTSLLWAGKSAKPALAPRATRTAPAKTAPAKTAPAKTAQCNREPVMSRQELYAKAAKEQEDLSCPQSDRSKLPPKRKNIAIATMDAASVPIVPAVRAPIDWADLPIEEDDEAPVDWANLPIEEDDEAPVANPPRAEKKAHKKTLTAVKKPPKKTLTPEQEAAYAKKPCKNFDDCSRRDCVFLHSTNRILVSKREDPRQHIDCKNGAKCFSLIAPENPRYDDLHKVCHFKHPK